MGYIDRSSEICAFLDKREMPCYDSKYCAVGRGGHFLPVLGMRQRIGSGVTERKKMETVRFDELDLYPQVLRAIADMGFEEATPIQSQAIPVVMSGVDVIGQAQTGTGKTASFGIPVLHKVEPNSRKTQVIILSPTRELAIQVADEIRKLAKYMHGVKVLPVYGGQEIGRQIKALKGGAQIIVGTPGRVMDHLRRKTIRCDAIHTVVLLSLIHI